MPSKIDRPDRPYYKHGELSPEGKRFWAYVWGKEYWVTPEKFDYLRAKARAAARASYAKNREKAKQISKEWREKNPEKMKECCRRWKKNNPDVVKAGYKSWAAKNPDYRKRRMKTDALYALARNLRNRLNLAFKKSKFVRPKGLGQVLGCTLDQAKAHIESQFKEGMSWENYGQWHVDHIAPLSSAKTEKAMISLCHYTNLQPLWAFENLSKGAKI